MSDVPPSIWNQDEKGDWKLYFNTNSDIHSYISQSKDQQKHNNNLCLSNKNLLLGTLVMTSKGIGRLIKCENKIANVRFNQDNKDYKFPLNEVSNTFNCFIYFILKGNYDVIRLKLKVSGKVENIFEELSKIKKINLKSNNYLLMHNKNILHNEISFEQLNFFNNAKILILETKPLELKISRYQLTQKFWYIISQDGIVFSVSKNIKLLGISLYCPYDNKVLSGIIKIIEGASFSGKIFLEENVEIQPSYNNLDTTFKINFSKPVICKKDNDYTIIFFANALSKCYSGIQGKNIIEGDKGVLFTFKKLEGNKGGSNVNVGNFPELYYCLD